MEPRYPVKLAGASEHVFTCSLGTIDTKLKIYRNDFLIEARSFLTGPQLPNRPASSDRSRLREQALNQPLG